MKVAIENFSATTADNKVLLLGAMAELGDESLSEHEAIVELLKRELGKCCTRWRGFSEY